MIRLKYNNKLFKILDSCSFKESNSEVTFNDLKIDFTGYSFEDIPFKYQKVEIIQNSKVIFTGYVETAKPNFVTKKKKGYRELTITLLSPLKMATVRTVSLIGTYSKEEAIRRILQPLIDDGFRIMEFNIEEGQITTNFVLETIENAMNNVSSKINLFWHIDENRGIYVNSIDYLFGKEISKKITENDNARETGLIAINPTIENIDYSNIINFKNIRLIYSQTDNIIDPENPTSNGNFPLLPMGKVLKKGDSVTFNNPIIVDEDTLRDVIAENEETTKTNYNALYLMIQEGGTLQTFSISINKESSNISDYDKYIISENISFSDDSGEEAKIVLQKDNFFSNLITGFKWNGNDNAKIVGMYSDTGLRYTTMRFAYTKEIENSKGIVSDSGQIERTIDYNEKWTTLDKLVTYARSLMTQNSNIINSVELEYDKNPNLKIGDIVDIQMPSFYVSGKFAVKEKNYTYKNKIVQNWKLTLKSADLISTYIDIFRPAEKEETQDKIDTVILSEFIEESINEVHTVEISNPENHTLNFNL